MFTPKKQQKKKTMKAKSGGRAKSGGKAKSGGRAKSGGKGLHLQMPLYAGSKTRKPSRRN